MPSVTTLLTDPDGFFGTRTPDPSVKGPIGVIVLIAAVNVVASIFQFRFTSQVFESASAGTGVGSGLTTAFQAFSFVFVIAGPFVVWLLYAGVFHAVSLVFDGDGEFSGTLALVGWGFLPSVFGSVASAAINYYRFNVETIEVPAEFTQETMRQFMHNVNTGPLVALSAALGIVFTLWSAFLWTFAVKHARDLRLRNAAITVAVPVALGLLVTLRTLFVALEVL
ncbi:MAG: Yip1 family protein [Halosimplex sp.]